MIQTIYDVVLAVKHVLKICVSTSIFIVHYCVDVLVAVLWHRLVRLGPKTSQNLRL